jgi:hypothetical protein
MKMTINLLNTEAVADKKREEAIMFVTAIAGMISGAIISAGVIILS